jgi:hypothetical protein
MIPLIGTPRINEMEFPQGADPEEVFFSLNPNDLEAADSAWMTGMGPQGSMDSNGLPRPGDSSTPMDPTRPTHRVDGQSRGTDRNHTSSRGTDSDSATQNAANAEGSGGAGDSRGNENTSEKMNSGDHARFQQNLRNAQKEGMKNGVENFMEGLDERTLDRLRKAGANRRKNSVTSSNEERISSMAKRASKSSLGGDAQKTAAVTAVAGIARALSDPGQGAERPVSIDPISSIGLGGGAGARATAAQAVDATTAASSKANIQARFEDLLSQVKDTDSGDSVLRIQDTEAGELEVRVTTNGQDLSVRVHALDATLRDRMLETLPELKEALLAEGLVEGQVDVGEQGLSDSNSSQGGSGHPNEEGSNAPSNTTRVAPQTEHSNTPDNRVDNGRFHVVA